MNVKEIKLKTTLNCGGCVAKVQSDFDNNAGISEWKVDLTNPDKILTVQSAGITSDEVVEILKKKGFNAEVLKG